MKSQFAVQFKAAPDSADSGKIVLTAKKDQTGNGDALALVKSFVEKQILPAAKDGTVVSVLLTVKHKAKAAKKVAKKAAPAKAVKAKTSAKA